MLDIILTLDCVVLQRGNHKNILVDLPHTCDFKKIFSGPRTRGKTKQCPIALPHNYDFDIHFDQKKAISSLMFPVCLQG